MTEQHIEAARTIKAAKLAQVFREHNAEPSTVAQLPDKGWRRVEQLAGTRRASEMTRAVVMTMLDNEVTIQPDSVLKKRRKSDATSRTVH